MFKMPVWPLMKEHCPMPYLGKKRCRGAAEAGFNSSEISIDESDGRLSRLDRTASERQVSSSFHRQHWACEFMSDVSEWHRKLPLEIRRQGQDISRRKAIDFAGDVGLRVL